MTDYQISFISKKKKKKKKNKKNKKTKKKENKSTTKRELVNQVWLDIDPF